MSKTTKIEVRQVGKPDEMNKTPYYAPCGVDAKTGKLSYAFGGSETYARRKAKKMLAEGRYTEVWIELSFAAGSI